MNKKQKGSGAERELIHLFWDNGWAAFRAAGSGSMPHPCPDLIAGNAVRKLGIEVKFVNDTKKYFTFHEIEDLRLFCNRFGCEAWVGVKFQRKGWHFYSIEDLRKTDTAYVADIEADHASFSFENLITL